MWLNSLYRHNYRSLKIEYVGIMALLGRIVFEYGNLRKLFSRFAKAGRLLFFETVLLTRIMINSDILMIERVYKTKRVPVSFIGD